jgi:flagella basal body P-ring formation protein FlgA
MAQKWIVREIDDPNTGDYWLLVRNDQIPGGPGRLVLAAAHRNASDGAALPAARLSAGEAEFLPVIRTGDRLIVEEHTARVDAVLEARALNPAAPGAMFDVRLRIGGRVVRAVALGPGRATLHPEAEVRP